MDGGQIRSFFGEMLISRCLLDIQVEMSNKPWVYKPGVQKRSLGWKYTFGYDCLKICISGHNEIIKEVSKGRESRTDPWGSPTLR